MQEREDGSELSTDGKIDGEDWNKPKEWKFFLELTEKEKLDARLRLKSLGIRPKQFFRECLLRLIILDDHINAIVAEIRERDHIESDPKRRVYKSDARKLLQIRELFGINAVEENELFDLTQINEED
jgi:hypothetical protein